MGAVIAMTNPIATINGMKDGVHSGAAAPARRAKTTQVTSEPDARIGSRLEQVDQRVDEDVERAEHREPGVRQHAFGPGGVKFDHDGVAEIYANTQTQTFLEGTNPGNAVTGVLVFDIPKDKTIVGLELHESPFSGGVLVDVA